MPVYKKNIINNDSILLIWKIEEDYPALMNSLELSKESIDKIHSFSSDKRKVEFLSTRKLLREAGYSDTDLTYNSDGAPLLINSNISISHTRNYVAVFISSDRVGVDLERKREQLFRISHKFINKAEEKIFDTASLEMLSILWSCKEAMFKLCKRAGIDFKENLMVTKVDIENKILEGEILFDDLKTKVKGSLDIFDNHTLVYLMND
ncbi:MAG: 4'-phosphopantetheinyl transferase superfamily protein [Bacteroidota bacterium]